MRRIIGALAIVLLASACGVGGGAGGGGDVPADGKLRVATWNLYYGADLGAAVLAVESGDPEAIVAAVSGAHAQLMATDFRRRVQVVADEIVAHGTDLVGLQEAVLWRRQYPSDTFSADPTPATDVMFDFVQLLVDALAERGATYEVAVSIETFDAELPRLNEDGALEDLRLSDREVILVRRSSGPWDPAVTILGTDAGLYGAYLELPSGLAIPQGWVAVDAELDGRRFRLVSTHLEADFAQIRLAQAEELVGGPAAGLDPTFVVGDFNTDALAAGTGAAPTYDVLTGSGLQDACIGWPVVELAGTATRSASLDDPLDVLTERIDLVLQGGAPAFAIDDVRLLGAAPEHFVDGLWPSDHAGVAVTLDPLPAVAE